MGVGQWPPRENRKFRNTCTQKHASSQAYGETRREICGETKDFDETFRRSKSLAARGLAGDYPTRYTSGTPTTNGCEDCCSGFAQAGC